MKKGLGSRLGKGFDSLFSEDFPSTIEPETAETELKITEIEPNKYQPRREFDKEKLQSLAESIKEHGIIQPLVVVKNASGMYTIVAGERRWRAAKVAGLKTVPAVIKEYTPEQIAQIALIENLQREDLNPIEEALGYQSLIDEYNMTQENISHTIGKSRSAVANALRLLALEDEIKKMLEKGELTSGHARAVLSLSDKKSRLVLAKRIIDEGLNVRQAENLAKYMQKAPAKRKAPSDKQIELEAFADKLSLGFGTKVKISQGAKKGKIEIEYYNNSDFDRIIKLFNI